MHEKLETAIHSWQEADKNAQENPDLLLPPNWSPENSRIAADRMKVLFSAERDLIRAISEVGKSETPQPLIDWILTYPVQGEESGCGNCWFSSGNDSEKHPECVLKIKRFFDAVNAMRAL